MKASHPVMLLSLAANAALAGALLWRVASPPAVTIHAPASGLAAAASAAQASAQAVLSPDRDAEYAASMTPDGRGRFGQLIARLDLPMTTITTVNAVRDDISARTKAVNADDSLSAADRGGALAALGQEAQQMLTSSLGDRGYRACSDMKGDWLRALKPKG